MQRKIYLDRHLFCAQGIANFYFVADELIAYHWSVCVTSVWYFAALFHHVSLSIIICFIYASLIKIFVDQSLHRILGLWKFSITLCDHCIQDLMNNCHLDAILDFQMFCHFQVHLLSFWISVTDSILSKRTSTTSLKMSVQIVLVTPDIPSKM